MSRHARRRRDGDQPIGALPSIEQCMYHRCDDHEEIPQLNDSERGAECGACLLEMLTATRAQLLLALDGYAERLTYGRALAHKLDSARARLNLLSPGAGDSLIEGDDGEEEGSSEEGRSEEDQR